MRIRLTAALVLLALCAIACSGGPGTPSTAGLSQPVAPSAHRSEHHPRAAVANVVADPGFESGGFSSGWTQCGSLHKASIVTARPHSGAYSALLGSTTSPEVNGTEGVCQTVSVPSGGQLTFWVYEGTNDTIQYADQEADLLGSGGATLVQLYKEALNARGWVQKTFDVSAYAGQSVTLYFGVKGNGWTGGYVYAYLDDVSLTGSGATTPPSPTPSPTTSPTAKPTATPTSKPTSSPYACNDQGFVSDQQSFASGKITADQFVQVCGTVTQVLPSKVTSSGNHGYFYVTIPGAASPGTIEIVSNLDAMAQAPTGDPPAWPWVSTGDYVYVQGRYYYDNSSSQGIDWTEDDSSGSWPHTGYVVVCSSSGTGCVLYQ